MSGPQTEAGRALQRQLAYERNPEWYLPGDIDTRFDKEILAIEQEARSKALADVWSAVDDLGVYPAASPAGERTPFQSGYNQAVLEVSAAIDALTEAGDE